MAQVASPKEQWRGCFSTIPFEGRCPHTHKQPKNPNGRLAPFAPFVFTILFSLAVSFVIVIKSVAPLRDLKVYLVRAEALLQDHITDEKGAYDIIT